jgi:hypothetical protein
MKLRQSYLVGGDRARDILSKLPGPAPNFSRLWIGLDQIQLNGKFLIPALAYFALPSVLLIQAFYYTSEASNKIALFWATAILITAAYVIWWILAFEMYLLHRQLRQFASDFTNQSNRIDHSTLEYLHRHNLKGVYRLLCGPGPSHADAVSKCPRQRLPGSVSTLIAFRELHFRFVVIKNQFLLLLMGALLLLVAVASSPFTSTIILRVLATVTCLTLLGAMCVYFWKLECDESLSVMLGTTPNELDPNFQNVSFIVSMVVLAALLLVSQLVPGLWQEMSKLVEPFSHLGH